VDSHRFVRELIAAVPEASEHVEDWLDDGEALAYPALGQARSWLEDHVLDLRIMPLRASVRAGREDVFRRFWAFVEERAATDDRSLRNLLMIELFEGVWWTEDVMDYLGPSTRRLLDEARVALAPYNGAIGRRPPPRRGKKPKPGRPW
jgi:hypothetical protein